MQSPPHQTAPAATLRPWILTAIFAVAALLAGIGYWTGLEQGQVRERLIELQQVEIAALQTALETESMVSAGSLQQLRQVGAGRSISALAMIRPPEATGENWSIAAGWSDELAAGFLLLPSAPSAPAFDGLKVFLAAGDKAAKPLPINPGRSPRIIGFTQPAGDPPPDRLVVEFAGNGPTAEPRRFEVDWRR